MNSKELKEGDFIYCKEEFVINLFSTAVNDTRREDIIFSKHHRFVVGPLLSYSGDIDIFDSENPTSFFVMTNGVMSSNYYIHTNRFNTIFETKIERSKRIAKEHIG